MTGSTAARRLNLALDLRRDAALLAGGVDLELVSRAGRCGRDSRHRR